METFRQLGLGEVVADKVLPACTDDDCRASTAQAQGQAQGPGPAPGAPGGQPNAPGASAGGSRAPVRLDVGDEQEYAPAHGLNPLAQFRFERPPRFPVPEKSHELLMKP